MLIHKAPQEILEKFIEVADRVRLDHEHLSANMPADQRQIGEAILHIHEYLGILTEIVKIENNIR